MTLPPMSRYFPATKMYHVFLQILLMWAHLPNGVSSQRLPFCSNCLKASDYDAPGIGIYLGLSHGTSAVHLSNGTVFDLAIVTPSTAYVALMHRLAFAPGATPPTLFQRLLRNLRKRAGRPATQDVGEIAAFLSKIYATSRHLFPEFVHDKVAVASPAFPALPSWDLNDALEHAGLSSWLLTYDRGLYPGVLSAGRAAAGGSGIGLCKHYRRVYQCQAEARERPFDTVYTISFTKSELFATMDVFSLFSSCLQGSETRFYSNSSGLGSIPSFPSPAAFWAQLRSDLMKLPLEYGRSMTKVVVTGDDSISNAQFRETLRDALHNISVSVSLKVMAEPGVKLQALVDEHASSIAPPDPIYAAARGAALYARWRQESQFYCYEDDVCDIKRDQERQGASGRGFQSSEL